MTFSHHPSISLRDRPGHELCFQQSPECPKHDCPNTPDGCVLVPPESGEAPLEIDFDGLCCPSVCFAVIVDTGEPCMATGKIPVENEHNHATDVFPVIYDSVTGREICYAANQHCPPLSESSCPPVELGCTLLSSIGKEVLLVDPVTDHCCPLPCASRRDSTGNLCSWLEGDHVDEGDGTYVYSDC